MDTRVLFVWTSGVLFPTLDTVLTEAVASLGITGANLAGLPRYRELAENLALGKINDLEFCQIIMTSFGIKGPPELLRTRILDRLTLTPGMLETLAQAKSGIDRWLVVDLPEAWFTQASAAKEVYRHFPPERIIYLGNSSLFRMIPDVFYYLPNRVQVSSDQCLLLDRDMKRTVQSINHGLQAAVVLNPERLRREFLLRKLTTQEYRMHHRPV